MTPVSATCVITNPHSFACARAIAGSPRRRRSVGGLRIERGEGVGRRVLPPASRAAPALGRRVERRHGGAAALGEKGAGPPGAGKRLTGDLMTAARAVPGDGVVAPQAGRAAR